MQEEFPSGRNTPMYVICDPWESAYQPTSPADDPGDGQQRLLQLCPSTPIVCCRRLFFFRYKESECLFSGAVASGKRGITVAHATNEGGKIVLGSARTRTIGTCQKTYDILVRQTGEKLSADLALLELHCDEHFVDNTIRWRSPSDTNRTLQIKIYKGEGIPNDRKVMILDQNGHFKYGKIVRYRWSEEKLHLHNVVGISTTNAASEGLTQEGDSGALVTSRPSNDSDIVYVYGIVTGICTTNRSPLTVANSLWDVTHELLTNPQYRTEFIAALGNNCNIEENIEFT